MDKIITEFVSHRHKAEMVGNGLDVVTFAGWIREDS